ncbi:MAG: transcription elongation factor NusA, utilization substance protein [Candidatus Parcubacteria bacterium]|jgi:N utilization substance protein A
MFDIKQMKVALETLEMDKKIPKEKIIDAIEQSIAAAYKKEYGKRGQIIRAKLDMDTGQSTFEQVKVVVDDTMVRMPEEDDEIETEVPQHTEHSRSTRHEYVDVSSVTGASDGGEEGQDNRPRYNEEHHMLIKDARLMKRDAELGTEIVFPLEAKADFGRIAAQTAKQVIIQKLREAEKGSIALEFGGKENSIVVGTVQRVDRGTIFVDLGRTTAVMPYEEQIPQERYRPGDRIRAYLFAIDEGVRGLSIRLSRSHPKFLMELFKNESPEIASGLVEIKSVAREPGSRSKIAVVGHDSQIDPIGACVGQRGVRVSAITSELSGEKIDIIEWSDNIEHFVEAALSPAKPLSIEINPEEKKATVTVLPEEQSLAIGKGGQNVRLAAKLTGFKIDIMTTESETENEANTNEETVLTDVVDREVISEETIENVDTDIIETEDTEVLIKE